MTLLILKYRKSNNPQFIPIESVNSSVFIVGRLGRPLGQVMTIRGRWVHTHPIGEVAKGDDWAFEVFEIDGDRSRKILFSKYHVEYAQIYYGRTKLPMPIPGMIHGDEDVWVMRAFEDATYMGLDKKAENEALGSLTNEIPSQMPPDWPGEYGFYSRLWYIRAEKDRGTEK